MENPNTKKQIEYTPSEIFDVIRLPDGTCGVRLKSTDNCPKEIVIPGYIGESRVTEISDMAFVNVKCLESVSVGEGIVKIGNYAFKGCTALKRISLPQGLTHIGNSAFYGCRCIESLTLPASLVSVTDNPFRLVCVGNISVDENNPIYKKQNGCIVEQTTGRLVAGDGASVIPGNVTRIGCDAFKECPTLKEIVIPDNVTHIDGGAFALCLRLSSVTLPKSITRIEDRAFYRCASLRRIIFGGTLSEWNAMYKISNWNELSGDFTVCCTDGRISKPFA